MWTRKKIMDKFNDHMTESLQYFNENHIVGLFLQGSQNYGLELPDSDVDTKLIITPSLKEIASNAKPISTTHIRANNEHIDFKDIRLYMETFRKQNINFMEILFTNYFKVNPLYADYWQLLLDNREEIAHMNPYRAVKAMKGMASEKYFSMEHHYPSKEATLAKFGYDPKQLHHLLRVEDFMKNYLTGVPYLDCLKPSNPDFLLQIKKGAYNLDKARAAAKISYEHIEEMEKTYCDNHKESEDLCIRELLEETQYNIIKTSIKNELQ